MNIAAYAQAILEHLDRSGDGIPCGKGYIPRGKKCSPEKRAQTSTAIRERGGIDKFKAKQRKRNQLKAEVNRSAGQKPREIDEATLRIREAFKSSTTKGRPLSPTYQEAIRRGQSTGVVEDFRQGTKDLLNRVRDEKAAKRAKSRPVGEAFIKPKDSPKDITNLSDKELQKAQIETSYFTPEGKRIHDEYQRRVAEHKAKNPGPNLFQQLEEGHKQRQKERVERFRNPEGSKTKEAHQIDKSFHIRDTLVDRDKFNALPVNQRQQILQLRDDFEKLGYIDARTQIGPDQARRQSERARREVAEKASQAFRIENQVKSLLRTPEEQARDSAKANQAQIQKQLDQVNNTLKTHESYNQRLINSPRSNATKRDYEEKKALKAQLEAQLKAASEPAKTVSAEVVPEPKKQTFADKMRATAQTLREETEVQKKATTRILGAAAQLAQNQEKLIDEVSTMVQSDLKKAKRKKKDEPTMTIIPGKGRQPSQAEIKTKSGTIRASIDSAHERGVMKALAFYAKAMGV